MPCPPPVLPAAPESVRSAEVTTNSVLLETEVGWPMDSFPRPLDFEVTYTSPWDPQPQVSGPFKLTSGAVVRGDWRPADSGNGSF